MIATLIYFVVGSISGSVISAVANVYLNHRVRRAVMSRMDAAVRQAESWALTGAVTFEYTRGVKDSRRWIKREWQ